MIASRLLDEDGMYLVPGTVAHSKQHLAVLLRGWLDGSPADTIGEIGTYGGKAWLWIELGDRRARLHADTTRTAVRAYLDSVTRHGATARWYVVENRHGRINKLLYAVPGEVDATGWYCYLTIELATAGTI